MSKIGLNASFFGAVRLAGRAGQNFVGVPTMKVGTVGESEFLSDNSMLRPEAEGEVRNTQTGELLAAGVDRRAGTKALGGSVIHSWGDAVDAIFDWGTV